MSLFEVEGWNLDNTKIKKGGAPKQKRKENKRKSEDVDGATAKRTKPEHKSEHKPEKPTKKFEKSEPKSEKAVRKSEKLGKPGKPEKVEPVRESPQLVTSTKLTPLQQKMMQKLSGSRFRWINEQLYTTTSNKALELIKEQPVLFDEYHQGFRTQVETWPENPVDVFVKDIRERTLKRKVNSPGGLPGVNHSRQVVIADMGCGEAKLSLEISKFLKQHKKKNFDLVVHSFDLKKVNDRITVADIADVPLEPESCSVAIFCLALMGTNFLDFIKEAHRILIPRGELWISEIKSRFADGKGEEFINAIKLCGFKHRTTDDSNKMFTRFEFFRPFEDSGDQKRSKPRFIDNESELEKLEKKREKVPEGQWLLKPCIYKRR